MEKLAPGVMWSFRFRAFVISFLAILIFFMILVLSNSFPAMPGLLILSISLTLIFSLLVAEIYARLAYKNWCYGFDDQGIKIETGIILKRYINIPYERIQNIDLSRGILARIFGFSTVTIQTAGNSGVSNAEGTLPGVEPEKAEEIRRFLMDKISGKAGV